MVVVFYFEDTIKKLFSWKKLLSAIAYSSLFLSHFIACDWERLGQLNELTWPVPKVKTLQFVYCIFSLLPLATYYCNLLFDDRHSVNIQCDITQNYALNCFSDVFRFLLLKLCLVKHFIHIFSLFFSWFFICKIFSIISVLFSFNFNAAIY